MSSVPFRGSVFLNIPSPQPLINAGRFGRFACENFFEKHSFGNHIKTSEKC